jgi:hypothetical protein
MEMKTFYAVVAPVFSFVLLTALFADEKPQVVDPDKIKDKISVTLSEEFTIAFTRDGDRLLKPTKLKETGSKKATIKVKLDVISASPFPPPHNGAKRPFLSIENNFENTLRFCVLVRLKASKEFFEISEGIEPVPAEEVFNKCWEFDTFVEEVVLFEFKLSGKSAT